MSAHGIDRPADEHTGPGVVVMVKRLDGLVGGGR
ncbi:hypothetical protein GGE06_001522 [Streptomyces sp. SFB5A]|uniref:Uncharacterized protein n=1 Tax=Streptomyces nymphaeiformis TaxID=2663842 RepID=A0A7W7X9N0_9ACTN|nr:hypothetical protein [Streptomyces nymphaeiformis]